MIELKELINSDAFKEKKLDDFTFFINNLTKYHYRRSKLYKKILDFHNFDLKKKYSLINLPFIPVRLFKNYELKSIDKKSIFKTLKSSGTSGNNFSKIHLDTFNSQNQLKVLSKITSKFIGNKRLPMLIFDNKNILNNSKSLSARGAAILGFSVFGRNLTYALNEDSSLDIKSIIDFYKKYKNQKFLIFGFTSIIWKKICLELKLIDYSFDFKNAILLHGGGWKKLEKKKISNMKFKNILKKNFNLKKVHNYYGMVEQAGSIFLECNKCGYFITSFFSDIIIRDNNFQVIPDGEFGLVQLISLLPTSYPGHNIITEDIGMIAKNNKCSCSKLGKRFLIKGRVEKAETRGCSNI
tara:strand:+ start:1120 stop:2178 length:1059 start_codon:yes stop_codon:yes gene_type:complete